MKLFYERLWITSLIDISFYLKYSELEGEGEEIIVIYILFKPTCLGHPYKTLRY